jgi:hypothetical protein
MRLSSLCQLLGNPRWQTPLLDLVERCKIGRIGPDLIDEDIWYKGWTDLVPDDSSIYGGDYTADPILDTIVVRRT